MTSPSPEHEHQPRCGRPPALGPAPAPALPPPQQVVLVGADSRAAASLALGVVALLLSWVPLVNALSLVMGVLSVALGALVLRRRRTPWPAPPSSRRLAVAGMCCGGAALVVTVAVVAFLVWWGRATDRGYVPRLT